MLPHQLISQDQLQSIKTWLSIKYGTHLTTILPSKVFFNLSKWKPTTSSMKPSPSSPYSMEVMALSQMPVLTDFRMLKSILTQVSCKVLPPMLRLVSKHLNLLTQESRISATNWNSLESLVWQAFQTCKTTSVPFNNGLNNKFNNRFHNLATALLTPLLLLLADDYFVIWVFY